MEGDGARRDTEWAMSDENVDRLRAAIEAFNERDGTKFDGLLAPNAEIVPIRAAVEGTTYRGRGAASQYLAGRGQLGIPQMGSR
jgi:hypothetical protein